NSSRKQGFQTHGRQSAEGLHKEKMGGASSGRKTAGLQQNSLEPALPGRWGFSLHPPSGSVRKARKNKQKTPASGDGGRTEAPQAPRKNRAWADPSVESEEAFEKRMEVEVKIPEELKPWLVHLVTRQKQLFQLPVKENIEAVLEEPASCKRWQGDVDSQEYAVNEVVGGIKEYFSVMLGTQLLYKLERPQYAEIHPDAPTSQVYAAPHLLRLSVRIGAMWACTPLDEQSLTLLLGYLRDFLKYLAKNSASLFTARDYKLLCQNFHILLI
uniref:Mortality factor 4-like protein 2 n=1 Tax=Otolemur garnettii TaxID=30611 RepID=H0XHI1_OTOGA